MYANELFEAPRRTIVLYAGRFQPFHKGHKKAYEHLVKKFGRDNVYISTSNKVELPKSPFSFSDKSYFMQMQGIPMDMVVESASPYRSLELVSKFDPNNTNLVVAVSEKDSARFGNIGMKKGGDLTYFQNIPDKLNKMESLANHGYVYLVPTFNFTVLGKPMRSATEVRAQYIAADQETRKNIIKDLFGTYTAEAQQIMDNKLHEDVEVASNDSTSPISTGQFESRGHKIVARKLADIEARKKRKREAAERAEQERKAKEKDQDQNLDKVNEMGGVGVIANKKQAKDPRYSMSLTKDVRPDAIEKSLKAFKLAEDIETNVEVIEENLRKWFKEKWVRFGPDGKIRGACARDKDTEGKPKCLPQSKAHALGKKGRASAAARKRKQDPNPERRGKAINVKTKENAIFELDLLAPRTTFFKLQNGRYVQADYRATGGYDSITSAIKFKFVDPQTANNLGLDQRLASKDNKATMAGEPGRRVIADPTAIQQGTPFSKTNIDVVDISNPPKDFPKDLHYRLARWLMQQQIKSKKPVAEAGKKDACYHKVRSRYKVWPSAYASGALVQCRKKGAKNWGKGSKK